MEAHRDHFADDAADEEWLHEIAARGWVVLTHDAKIRYTSAARDVILAQGARVIVLRGKAPAPELARSFAASCSPLERFLSRREAPFIAKFYRNPADPTKPGRLELWLAPE